MDFIDSIKVDKYCTGPLLTNTYVVRCGKDCVVIDPGMGFDEKAKEVKEQYNVKAVLLTHGHIDHIASIGYFDCPIYIGQEDAEFLKDRTLSLASSFGMKHNFDYDKLELHLVKENSQIDLGKLSFIVLSTPGHTRGSVCYAGYNILFSGDTLFRNSQGRTDFPTGDERKMKASLRKIVKDCADRTVVYPGHDEETTVKEERQNNPFVKKALK